MTWNELKQRADELGTKDSDLVVIKEEKASINTTMLLDVVEAGRFVSRSGISFFELTKETV